MKTVLLAGVLLAAILLTGCAPMLGAHVHHFEHQGVEYTKCTIVSERGHVEMAEDSWKICRDAITAAPPARR